MKNIRLALFLFLSLAGFCLIAQEIRPQELNDKYTLEELVVLSRHNIRSPLSGNGSTLSKLTPHEWTSWSSAPSELTSRGGALETIMGQYFRKWVVSQGLFPENYVPTADDVNIYANSMQRTIATAQYFTSGFLPVANVRINHRFVPSKMDPVFCPQITKASDGFRKQAIEEIEAMGGKKGMTGINENLAENYALIADVLDYDKSEAAKSEPEPFKDYNTVITLEVGKEPGMKGALKDANSASDAFILQYYEVPDTIESAFGHKIGRDEWAKIAKIKDVYGDVLFTAPSVAVNVAHPLLIYMRDELEAPNRKFTFLCGHDSNIASVNAALGVEDYELPNTIEKKTPIGSKLVIEKWKGTDGEQYARVNIVYQSTDQLRNLSLLDIDNPPMVFPLSFKGLEKNADGLYKLSDLLARFDEAISAYDKL